MAHNPSLVNLVQRVVSAIKIVDDHVLRSKYIRVDVLELEPEFRPVGFDHLDTEARIEDMDGVWLWEEYFEFLLKSWIEGGDGDRLSEAAFNFIIERLSAAASDLDHYGPQLVRAYRRIPSIPETRAGGIERRQTVLNGFLNSAEIALEQWYRHAGILEKRTLRRRRNILGLLKDEATEDVTSSEPLVAPSASRKSQGILPNAIRVLASNGTLIALSFRTTTAAGIVQAYGYWLASETGQPQHGTWNSPDCLSTIQSCIMQLLGLYITVLPALRHRSVRKSYAWWSFALAVLSATSAVLSVVCFFYNPAISQLALFLGSAMQAAIVMQMAFAVDRIVGSEVKENKWE
ncbi:hypothetical protein QBC44DRAFT_337458 [Cladorrhinum sp. PSN332]|nr:hypothetical protein QBC44DRAFT_337458 [Cladorrhinum sp. PSN332]